ncbi:Cupredoxin [Dactylonectria estremocensis]|uniref:laccase n=1 Tax=Dactylonectria estremocensis TaxID=1079267 RepID=A0A9P9EM52_9HYPO|nr:Cupredoxin [Dactylonectria estremocensis]
MHRQLLTSGVLIWTKLAAALPSAPQPHSPLQARSACEGNTPTTRSQWCDTDISTDYWVEPVDTGVTKEYWLDLSDVTVAPDGRSRSAMAINGSIPGPTLFADWGDTVVVHVTNSLTTSLNGSSIHWHGIRQNYTNQQDGVTAITQCPIAVGDTLTYVWKATQYGTSWYHSHFGLQAYQGIFGGLIINGPASANYDEDLGVVFLSDWDKQTVDELYPSAEVNGPPTLENGLINGTNVYTDADGNESGRRLTVAFEAGKTYRLRLVNSAIDSHWKFSIDNHTLTVISADLVPVEPYTATHVSIGIGQRVDVIVTADQASVAQNFWMRAIPQSACSTVSTSQNVRGIVHYGESPSTPETTGYEFTDGCEDETPNMVPAVPKTVEPANWRDFEDASVATNSAGVFKWMLNSTSFLVDWAAPTLESIMGGVTEYTTQNAVIEFNQLQWVYLIVQTTIPVPHPIHLHGHDYFILAQGTGTYDTSVALNTQNPPRRDTAMLPASGYLVMAWETDNPGAWLMHCHIGWHVSQGFALQFIERVSEIPAITDNDTLSDICTEWVAHKNDHGIVQHDSGV